MIKSIIILYLLYTIQAPLGWRIVVYVVLAWELGRVVRNTYLFCRGFLRRWKAIQTAYKSCFDDRKNSISNYRPLFWLKNEDKQQWKDRFEIKHSDCYEVFGLKRTGCACCPFGGKSTEMELDAVRVHEPKLYKLCMAVFGPSYEYTRKYREFVKMMDGKVKNGEIERP